MVTNRRTGCFGHSSKGNAPRLYKFSVLLFILLGCLVAGPELGVAHEGDSHYASTFSAGSDVVPEFGIKFDEPILDRPEATRLNGQLVNPIVTTVGPNFQFLNLLGNPTSAINLADGLSIDTEDGRLTLKPEDVQLDTIVPVRVRDSAAVLYREAYPDTDLAVVPNATGLTVLFHRKSGDSPLSYEWEVENDSDPFALQRVNETAVFSRGEPARRLSLQDSAQALTVHQVVDLRASYERTKQTVGSVTGSADTGTDEHQVEALLSPVRATLDERPPAVSVSREEIVLTVESGSTWAGMTISSPWAWEQSWTTKFGLQTQRGPIGLLKIKGKNGEIFYTHGPDKKQVDGGQSPTTDETSYPGYYCSDPGSDYCEGSPPNFTPMDPICSTSHNFTVIYAYHHTPISNTIKYKIRQMLQGMNGWLNYEHIQSGGVGARMKMRCNERGVPAVWKFATNGNSNPDVIWDEAKAAGYQDLVTKWIIFTDLVNPDACGYAQVLPDDSKWIFNYNNAGNLMGAGQNPYQGYSVVYGGCWQRGYASVTALHEATHMMGGVQYSAPDSNHSYHCRVWHDVMCQNDNPADWPGTLPQFNFRSCFRARYDCTKRSYFNASPAPSSYLATHWNIATSENSYLSHP